MGFWTKLLIWIIAIPTSLFVGLVALAFYFGPLPDPEKKAPPKQQPRRTTKNADGKTSKPHIDEVEEDDYYEILEVEVKASQEEIKTSYRRLSLLYHPDKNTDKDAATRRFQKLNAAYKERRMYNLTRSSRAREPEWASDDDEEEDEEEGHRPNCRCGEMREKFGLMWFSIDSFPRPMHGMPIKYFFATYSAIFDLIAADECQFGNGVRSSFPPFGNADWPWSATQKKRKGNRKLKPKLPDVKSFYDFWLSFTTKKNFPGLLDVNPWLPDDVKIKLARQNNALLLAERARYNEAVRNLAKDVRVRDPRR
ncbi:DnaJ domain-containing protein [Mycena floridula]|nr:DnaJ domain-containing protein [Mycena floridula]